MGAREHYFARFAEQETALAGAHLPWLRAARQAAMARFGELGFPGNREEEWKYTSVTPIEKCVFRLQPAETGQPIGSWVRRLAMAGSYRLVFVNGRHAPELSELDPLPAGVRIGSLAQAINDAPGRGAAYGENHLLAGDNATHGFTALNAACWSDGALIELAPGVALAKPIQLLFITTGQDLATFPCNLVRIGQESQATIVEHYAGTEDATYLSDAVTAIELGEKARLTHARLQQEGPRAFHIAEARARQAAGSCFTSHSYALGSRLSRYELATQLAGEDCEAELLGLYLGRGHQHMDHHTRIDHGGPRGISRQVYQGVLDGTARAVFNGKIVVRQGAQQTDARQVNRNLLLSRDAEVDTKPQLEIFTDDVKCSHGATVGQLDGGQVHYLRARGLAEAEARALLIYGFASAVLDRLAVPALRTLVAGLVRERLPADVERLLCDTI